MNLRRRIMLCAVILLALTAAGIVFAQPVTLSVRYENKRIYVPSSEIFVKLTVRNESSQTYRFKLAENRMFNVDFDVRTLSNLPLPPAPHFTTERTSNQQLYYRDVVLEPEEEFSFVEDLSNYVEIDRSGVYVVRVTFYPDLVSGPETRLVAPSALSLTVEPPMDAYGEVQASIDDRTGEILRREAMPPDEVVAYVIQALQDGAWNRFFLYMDVEGLLLSAPSRARAYRQMSEAEQRARLTQFQRQLEDSLEDPELSAIPTDYRMVRTTYDRDEGTVLMDMRFQYPSFTEVKRYTYFLRRRDGVWYIYDYAVTNLGAE